MSGSERSCKVVTDLLASIYDRPHMYCRTLGEVDTLLYYLHHVWAEVADRREFYEKHRADHHLSLGIGVRGILTNDRRTHFVESAADHGVQEVINYWKQLDDRLGLHPGSP